MPVLQFWWVIMFIICTTPGFVFLSKKGRRVYLASHNLAWVCSPIRITFLSEHVFLSHKEQPLCNLVLLSNYETSAPLRADREQQLFQYGLLQTELQLCTFTSDLYVSLLVIFLPGNAKVSYEYLITNFQICSSKNKAFLCRLMLLGKQNGTVCACVFFLTISY